MVEMKLRGVNKVTAKGKTYYYHRKSGKRLAAEFGTAEFVAELQRLNQKPARKMTNTLGGLIEAYRGSVELKGLRARTQKDYGRVLDYLVTLKDDALQDFDSASIIEIRDAAYEAHKWRFANYTVQVMRVMFRWGKNRRWVKANPCEDVPLLGRPKDWDPANRPWEMWELRNALREATPAMRAAISLGLMALREEDMVKFPWTGYRKRRLKGRHSKNRKPFDLAVPGPLAQILDTTPKRAVQIVTGQRSHRPYTVDGFRAVFFRFLGRLEKAELVGPDLTFHGLRHSVGGLISEIGFDTRSIAAWLGHMTEEQARHYSRRADDRQRTGKIAGALGRKMNGFAKPADKSAKPGIKKTG